jgi:hypothetical protein
MRVRIDEARRHNAAAGVQFHLAARCRQVAYARDAVAADAYIAIETERARAIDDGRVADEKIELFLHQFTFF